MSCCSCTVCLPFWRAKSRPWSRGSHGVWRCGEELVSGDLNGFVSAASGRLLSLRRGPRGRSTTQNASSTAYGPPRNRPTDRVEYLRDAVVLSGPASGTTLTSLQTWSDDAQQGNPDQRDMTIDLLSATAEVNLIFTLPGAHPVGLLTPFAHARSPSPGPRSASGKSQSSPSAHASEGACWARGATSAKGFRIRPVAQ
jgi:hypothetical protein